MLYNLLILEIEVNNINFKNSRLTQLNYISE